MNPCAALIDGHRLASLEAAMAIVIRQLGVPLLSSLLVAHVATIASSSAAASAAEAVTLEGALEVVVEDHPEGARLVHSVRTPEGRYTLEIPGKTMSPGRPGERVRVDGTRDGRRIVAHRVAPVAAGALAADAASLPETTGVQRTLVLMLKFPEYPAEPFTAAAVRDLVFDAPTSMNAFMREASFDQVSFAGDVVGWLTLPAVPPSCDGWMLLQDAIAAADPLVDFAQVDRLILLSPGLLNAPGCPINSGAGTVGKIEVDTGEGLERLSVTWAETLTLFLLSHEMGHNLGLLHANLRICDTETIDESCPRYEYQDPFSVMGTEVRHFNAPQKELLGWLQPANLAEAAGDGLFTVQAIETPSGAIQALKVAGPLVAPFTTSRWFYYVEHREAVGFDAPIADYPSVVAGAQVRRLCTGCLETELLRTPGTDSFDAVLPGGMFLLDGPTPLFVLPIATANGALDVRLRHFQLLQLADREVAIDELLALRVPARDLGAHALAFAVAGEPAGAALRALGDADLDGSLTAADATLASSLAASPASGTGEQRAVADADGDGAVTAADAAAIGEVVAAQAPPFNTGVLLWRPDGTQCGSHALTFTVSEGTQSASWPVTVVAGRPRVVSPLPGAAVWGRARVAVQTGCPDVSVSIGALPPQPLPAAGVLWDTRGVADGTHELRATAAGGLSQVWTVQIQNQPPLVQLRSGSVKHYGPGRPNELSLEGTLGIPGVMPLSLPQGGAPWFIAAESSPAFYAVEFFDPVTCNVTATKCTGTREGLGPTGTGKLTVKLQLKHDLIRFKVKGRDAATISELPHEDRLVFLLFCFASGDCGQSNIQFGRLNTTTYGLRKMR